MVLWLRSIGVAWTWRVDLHILQLFLFCLTWVGLVLLRVGCCVRRFDGTLLAAACCSGARGLVCSNNSFGLISRFSRIVCSMELLSINSTKVSSGSGTSSRAGMSWSSLQSATTASITARLWLRTYCQRWLRFSRINLSREKSSSVKLSNDCWLMVGRILRYCAEVVWISYLMVLKSCSAICRWCNLRNSWLPNAIIEVWFDDYQGTQDFPLGSLSRWINWRYRLLRHRRLWRSDDGLPWLTVSLNCLGVLAAIWLAIV